MTHIKCRSCIGFRMNEVTRLKVLNKLQWVRLSGALWVALCTLLVNLKVCLGFALIDRVSSRFFALASEVQKLIGAGFASDALISLTQ
jgi:hypothetical protein